MGNEEVLSYLCHFPLDVEDIYNPEYMNKMVGKINLLSYVFTSDGYFSIFHASKMPNISEMISQKFPYDF